MISTRITFTFDLHKDNIEMMTIVQANGAAEEETLSANAVDSTTDKDVRCIKKVMQVCILQIGDDIVSAAMASVFIIMT